MSGPVDLGDSLPLEFNVVDASGNPTSCATAVLTITKPDGTSDTPALTQSPTGTYIPTVPYVPAAAGRHSVRFVGTSPAVAITDVFDVQAAAPALLFSLDDARTILQIPDGDTAKDGLLREYIAAVTTIVEFLCGPQVSAQTTRNFDGGKAGILLPANLVSVDQVTEANVVLDPTNDYTVDLVACILYRGTPMAVFSFVSGFQNITVKYTCGGTSIAPNVLMGARLILRHLWQNTQQGYRPSFGSPDTSTSQMTNVLGYLIPNAAMSLLKASPPNPGFA